MVSILHQQPGRVVRIYPPAPPWTQVRDFLKSQQVNAGPLDVCGVVVLRDPISHFISGYNEVETRRPLHRGANRFGLQLTDTNISYSHLPLGSGERFAQFVRSLVAGEWGERGVYDGKPLYHHVSLMSGMLAEMQHIVSTSPAHSTIR